MFKLRTCHKRLNHHLSSKLHIAHTEQRPCSTGSQKTEHRLQSCPLCKLLRKGIWPDHTPVAHSPQALQQPQGLTMYCSLHQGDWSFHLTHEKKKEEELGSPPPLESKELNSRLLFPIHFLLCVLSPIILCCTVFLPYRLPCTCIFYNHL